MNKKKIAGILTVIVMSVIVFGYLSTPVWAVNPVLVKDVENPAQSPFFGHGSGTILTNYVNVNIECGVIPAGKRLVIEHVAARCHADTDDSIPEVVIWVSQKTGIGYNTYTVPLLVQKQGTTFDGKASWVVSQLVRLYSDGGAGGSLSVMVYHSKVTTTAACFAHISGYLVDTP